MKTIKLPIEIQVEDEALLHEIQRECSSLFRWSFNRYNDEIDEKEQRELFHNLNYEYLDSWLVQSILKDAAAFHASYKSLKSENPVCFGKQAFIKYSQNKISKDELKASRLRRIISCGEASKNGNRKFKIQNDIVILKYTAKHHFHFKLPKLKKKMKQELQDLSLAMQEKKLAVLFSISPSKKFVYITFDETKLYKKEVNDKIKDRILAVDLNPDYIGWSISDVSKKQIVDCGTFDLKEMQETLSKKGFRNKFNYESVEICHDLKKKFDHYKCDKFVIEELKFEPKSLGNKNLNRKCKNQFNYSKVITKLKGLFSKDLVEVNPAYTSFIGNMCYEYHDPVNASLEIGRRGCYKFKKNMFYPDISEMKLPWKQKLVSQKLNTWKNVFTQIKNLKVRYRVQLEDIRDDVSCFKWKCVQSKVKQIKHFNFV